jgi:hypothetical protein
MNTFLLIVFGSAIAIGFAIYLMAALTNQGQSYSLHNKDGEDKE